jgi:hypothetical protein
MFGMHDATVFLMITKSIAKSKMLASGRLHWDVKVPAEHDLAAKFTRSKYFIASQARTLVMHLHCVGFQMP